MLTETRSAGDEFAFLQFLVNEWKFSNKTIEAVKPIQKAWSNSRIYYATNITKIASSINIPTAYPDPV